MKKYTILILLNITFLTTGCASGVTKVFTNTKGHIGKKLTGSLAVVPGRFDLFSVDFAGVVSEGLASLSHLKVYNYNRIKSKLTQEDPINYKFKLDKEMNVVLTPDIKRWINRFHRKFRTDHLLILWSHNLGSTTILSATGGYRGSYKSVTIYGVLVNRKNEVSGYSIFSMSKGDEGFLGFFVDDNKTVKALLEDAAKRFVVKFIKRAKGIPERV